MNGIPEKISDDQPKLLVKELGKKYRKWSWLLIIAGAVLFSMIGGPGLATLLGILIGWVFGNVFTNVMVSPKLIKINLKNNPLPTDMTPEQLYDALSSSLHPDDFKVEKHFKKVRVHFKNKTVHVIWLDREKQTYSIISKLRKKAFFLTRYNLGFIEYAYSCVAYPVIKKSIETYNNFKHKKA
ncbi:hypothetical protein PTI45_02047 [Paenibacillus nuruki]|uniref:Uncharacterized protein n=1 Tax=Paenibacillus nuruki TaxID=1886670 RepID=A0A1E3L3W1_9BACL|nr:hypothetical protein [Paenibacillus nuruki]ODP28502.1 hypothetical protein PTI45_02047 [Paenibacillus nuruki]